MTNTDLDAEAVATTARAMTSIADPRPEPGARVDPSRLRRAKAAYTTRFLHARLMDGAGGFHLLSDPGTIPCSGDILLARIGEIGQHQRLEGPTGRRQLLFQGDEVLVAYGNRYAPDQFEAEVPNSLMPTHLVAAGGVAATVLSQHAAMLPPTALHPVGLLADEQGRVTLSRCAPFSTATWGGSTAPARQMTIAVVGTSMNSGKTTTVASIVRGLTAAGFDVAAGKVTGTGAGGDPGLFVDAGATTVVDFTHFGRPSTYLATPEDVRELLLGIHTALASQDPDVMVLEVADGMFQAETAALVGDPAFRELVGSVVFAASEAMGAVAGVSVLRGLGLPVHAVSGLLTASPLATREARGALDLPVLTSEQLHDPEQAHTLLPVPWPGEIRGLRQNHVAV